MMVVCVCLISVYFEPISNGNMYIFQNFYPISLLNAYIFLFKQEEKKYIHD